jgi:hypothetical protein
LSRELQSDGGCEVCLKSGDFQPAFISPGLSFGRFAGGCRKLCEQLNVFCSERLNEGLVVGIFDFMLEGESEPVRDVVCGGSLRLEEGEELSALDGEVGREAFNEGVFDAERLGVLSAHFVYPTSQEGSLGSVCLEFSKQGPFPIVGLLEELDGRDTLLDAGLRGSTPAAVDNRDLAWGFGHSVRGSRSSGRKPG